jgi:hypothetical protein
MDKPKQLKKNSKDQKKGQKVVEKTINGKTTTVILKPSSIQEALKYGGAKRKTYGKGGETEPEKTQPKSELGAMTRKDYRQLKKGAKREAKLERIKSGKQGDRVDNVIKAVGSGAEAVANVTNAVNSVRSTVRKTGGVAKKTYKTGGMVNSNAKVTASKVTKGRVGSTNKSVPRPKKR